MRPCCKNGRNDTFKTIRRFIMVTFLEKFFGQSWRTSFFACLSVAFIALAGVDTHPVITKFAIAAAAVSQAIGLFMARDNKVSSSQIEDNGKGITK
jgi:hypothetical protein